MYYKGYGIVETLAPLHVGASAGEETGNLNLIFRDRFIRTGIVPGSSLRGRFRADMRHRQGPYTEWYGKDVKSAQEEEATTNADSESKSHTTEGLVKFEYASLLWLPVYCPGQPIVRVSCPELLRRYDRLRDLPPERFSPYSYYQPPNAESPGRDRLFFNLGFLPLKEKNDTLANYMPAEIADGEDYLFVVVKDREMAAIHDMALYRQSRVQLQEEMKVNANKGFFNVEALPEKTVMVFPMAIKPKVVEANPWPDFLSAAKFEKPKELYLGGLESIGFGRTQITLHSLP